MNNQTAKRPMKLSRQQKRALERKLEDPTKVSEMFRRMDNRKAREMKDFKQSRARKLAIGIIIALVGFILLLALVGCGSNQEEACKFQSGERVALVCDTTITGFVSNNGAIDCNPYVNYLDKLGRKQRSFFMEYELQKIE
jgi:hypothetical protein